MLIKKFIDFEKMHENDMGNFSTVGDTPGSGDVRMPHEDENGSGDKCPMLEDHTICPVCQEKCEGSCKCASFVKHNMDSLRKGHGYRCPNGHQWSYQTADGNLIILK